MRITEALALVDAPDDRVQAIADLGGVPSAGDRSAVVEACEEGLRLARAEGADPEAVRWLEAHVLAEAREDPALRRRSHALLGSAGPADDGTPGGRALLAQRALEAVLAGRPVGDVRDLAEHALGRGALLAEDRPGGAHVCAAVRALTYADELQSAELALAMAIERARASGSPEAYARLSGLRAGVALRRGSLSDAIADARASLAAGPDVADPRMVAVLATALLERGESEEAGRLIERAGPDDADPAGAAVLLVARARLALDAGDHDTASADALAAGEHQRALLADSPAVLPWRTEAALALAARDRPEASRLAVAQLDLARATRIPRALGVALRTLGLVEGGQHGLELLGQAVAALADSRALLARAHTLVAYGEALVAADRAVEGRRVLREGLDVAGRCGATVLAVRASEALAEGGSRVTPEAGAGLEALTPSERRVADLATDGRDPHEIADALFLTVKTVEWQLRSACAKLGAGSQDELLDALRRASPVPVPAADAAPQTRERR
jgi:DNA-binding CsgD family transcriptional regulator